MLRYLIALLALATTLTAAAQSRTKYYDGEMKPTRKEVAQSYVTYTWANGVYDVTHYSMRTDKLRMKGRYTSMEGDLKTARDGKFIYYYANGRICDEGMYKSNLHTGVWKRYFFSTGKLMTEKSYALDSLDGPEVHYDKEGKKTMEGNNVNGAMEGVWKYYDAGHLYAEKTYKADELVAEKRYNDKGKIAANLIYKDGEFVSGTRYDGAGKTIPFVFTAKDSLEPAFKYEEQMPKAPYDITEFLSEHIAYPKKSVKNDEHGKVIVRFVIDEMGNIEDVTIKEGVSFLIDAEAIRVVSGMPPWSPGIQNGEAVKVYFNLPINFQLQ